MTQRQIELITHYLDKVDCIVHYCGEQVGFYDEKFIYFEEMGENLLKSSWKSLKMKNFTVYQKVDLTFV